MKKALRENHLFLAKAENIRLLFASVLFTAGFRGMCSGGSVRRFSNVGVIVAVIFAANHCVVKSVIGKMVFVLYETLEGKLQNDHQSEVIKSR
jgi:hypothetical protein